MDFLNVLLIILLLIIFFILIKKFFFRPEVNIKSVENKKFEIIYNYEQMVKTVIDLNRHDEEKLLIKKTELLKQISKELSTNIFFDKDEVRDIIQKLVNIN